MCLLVDSALFRKEFEMVYKKLIASRIRRGKVKAQET